MTNWWYFLYFSQKIGCDISCRLSSLEKKKGFEISCKLSPPETICIKCHILFFWGENKKHISMSSAENFTQTDKGKRWMNKPLREISDLKIFAFLLSHGQLEAISFLLQQSHLRRNFRNPFLFHLSGLPLEMAANTFTIDLSLFEVFPYTWTLEALIKNTSDYILKTIFPRKEGLTIQVKHLLDFHFTYTTSL